MRKKFFEVYTDENRLIFIPDAFFAKHSGTDGEREWSKRFRSKGEKDVYEEFNDVAMDEKGNVYIVGFAEGILFGDHLGEIDVILAKFDGQGNMIWGKQWGSDKGESGIAIALDEQGNIYVTGGTDGKLFETNVGEDDIFVVKFKQ